MKRLCGSSPAPSSAGHLCLDNVYPDISAERMGDPHERPELQIALLARFKLRDHRLAYTERLSEISLRESPELAKAHELFPQLASDPLDRGIDVRAHAATAVAS